MTRPISNQESLRLRNVSSATIAHRYIIVRDNDRDMKIISRRNDIGELIRFGKLYEIEQGEHMLLIEIETLLVHWEKAGPIARPYASA